MIGHRKDRPNGNPQRLAIERVAARLVQQHCISIKRRRIAEHRAEIIVIGNTAAHQHQRGGRKRGRHLLQPIAFHPAAERQNAAMQVETDDTVKHRRFGHINGNIIREIGKNIGNAGKPVFEDENAFRRKGATRFVGGGQHAQHHRAFGNEAALTPGQVTLANIAKGGDARIGRVFDRNQRPPIQQHTLVALTGHQQSHRPENGRPRR